MYEDKIANIGISPAEVLSTLSGQNKTVYSDIMMPEICR